MSEDLSPSHLSHKPEQSDNQLTSHPSRRTVLAGLIGLTLIGGGITWFATSSCSSSSPAPDTTPSAVPNASLTSTTLYTYHGHANGITSVAWSPEGKHIASGSADKTVQVWDAANGHNVYTYKGHGDQVWSVAWSPDGKRIVSVSWDQTVQVWNATDGSDAYIYKGHTGKVTSAAWSPDGKRIASASWDKTVQVWNATDGSNAYTYKGHPDIVNSVAWSPDSKRIASGSEDQTVQVLAATPILTRAILMSYGRWHGPPIASALPPAPRIRRHRSGMQLMAAMSILTRAILIS